MEGGRYGATAGVELLDPVDPGLTGALAAEPKVVLGMAAAAALGVVCVLIVCTTLGICAAAARKRRDAAEDADHAMPLRATRGRSKPQEVAVEGGGEGGRFRVVLPAGAADDGFEELREAIAEEIELETGEEVDADGLMLHACVAGTWHRVAADVDLDLWTRGKVRRVQREGAVGRKPSARGARRGCGLRPASAARARGAYAGAYDCARGPAGAAAPAPCAGAPGDLSNTPLPPRGNAPKIPAHRKVQAVLDHAAAYSDGPAEHFEPFGGTVIGAPDDDSRSEVLSLIYPNDSVSMIGAPRPPANPAGTGLGARTLDSYSADERANICTVYIRTAAGGRVAAKVDLEGIATTAELLRGLRAAFAHYTAEDPPPYGTLLVTAVAADQSELPMCEDVPSTQRPLEQLLPCSHVMMAGYDSPRAAAAAYAALMSRKPAGGGAAARGRPLSRSTDDGGNRVPDGRGGWRAA